MNSKNITFVITLLSFSALRIFLSATRFFILAEPSDQIQYLAPVLFGQDDYQALSFYGSTMLTSGWVWIDRIALGVGLAFVSKFPIESILIAPVYAGLVLVFTQFAAMLWLHKNSNIYAVIMFGILFNTSFMVNRFGPEVLPEASFVLFSVLAFVFAVPNVKNFKECFPIVAGIFSATVCLTKAPGVGIPIFIFIFLLLYNRKAILKFILGNILGVGLVIGLFCLLISVEAFELILKYFFDMVDANYHGRKNYNNFVSFLEVFFLIDYLPIFAFLFISAGALKLKETRVPFLYAWSFVVVIYAIYYLTLRGYIPKPRYIFPAVVLAALCMSQYFGHLVEQSWKSVRKVGPALSMLAACLCLIVAGFYLGDTYNPYGIFEPRKLKDYSRLAGSFYGIGAILSLVYLLALEVKPGRLMLVVFPLFLSLWTSSYCGGLATHYLRDNKAPKAKQYYERADLLVNIPERFVDVYIEEWKGNSRLYRVAYIYHLFYETWPSNKSDGTPDENRHRVRLHHSLELLKEKGKAPLILTNSPELIRETFGEPLELVRQFKWREFELSLLKKQ